MAMSFNPAGASLGAAEWISAPHACEIGLVHIMSERDCI
jgi:hypothetical protein